MRSIAAIGIFGLCASCVFGPTGNLAKVSEPTVISPTSSGFHAPSTSPAETLAPGNRPSPTAVSTMEKDCVSSPQTVPETSLSPNSHYHPLGETVTVTGTGFSCAFVRLWLDYYDNGKPPAPSPGPLYGLSSDSIEFGKYPVDKNGNVSLSIRLDRVLHDTRNIRTFEIGEGVKITLWFQGLDSNEAPVPLPCQFYNLPIWEAGRITIFN